MNDHIRDILTYIGENPDREGLKDTPLRMIKSWEHLFSGYGKSPKEVLDTIFIDNDIGDEMIILKSIDFYSICEHHFLPFFGKISIGYIPAYSIMVGISKLVRLVEIFSRRLQIQERLTTQIADSIMEYLYPKGCMIVVEAEHLCMRMRGVEKQNSIMRTQAVRGNFTKPDVKEEFLRGIESS